MVDPLLDARARTEHAGLSFHDSRSTSLVRFETTLAEPGDNGVAAALEQFRAGWHDVANNPGDLAARSQLLARAETLAGAVRAQDRAVTTEWEDQRTRLDALGAEVNQVAKQLADLNVGLRNADVAGTDAGTLLDQRDMLTLRLAELTGSTVTVKPDTTVEVRVGGEGSWSRGAANALDVEGNGTHGRRDAARASRSQAQPSAAAACTLGRRRDGRRPHGPDPGPPRLPGEARRVRRHA